MAVGIVGNVRTMRSGIGGANKGESLEPATSTLYCVVES